MPRKRPSNASRSSRRFSRNLRRLNKVKNPVPSAYFNEEFVVSYAEETNKRSKPRKETVLFMDTFITAKVDSVPPHASATVNDGAKTKMDSFMSDVRKETVVTFVTREKEKAKDVIDETRFKKVRDLLSSDKTKDIFLDFLKSEHCEELLMLLDEIDKVVKMKDLRKIEAANKHIFETYIADESPMQVNLDPQLQMALEHDYRSPAKRRTKVLFLAAKRELLRHLEFEFTRFREHENFYDLEVSQRAGDIDKWKNNFHDVLNDEVGRCVLLKFMMMERNEENLLFFMAVQRMKCLTDPEEIKENNWLIFETFIGDDEATIPDDMDFDMEGPTHVNIDWPVRDKIVEALKTNPTSKNIFDQAQTAILHSLLDEAWPRFKESEVLNQYKTKPADMRDTIYYANRQQQQLNDDDSDSKKKSESGGGVLKRLFSRKKS